MNRSPERSRRAPRISFECYEIEHPRVSQGVDGLTILHLSDFHLKHPWREDPRMVELLDLVGSVEVDFVALTGDYIERRGSEADACDFIETLSASWRARIGAYGIFGNHDTPELVRQVTDRVRWLNNERTRVGDLLIVGTSEPEDLLGAMAQDGQGGAADAGFSILLAHYPTQIVPAAAMGIDLVLAGHTHGGQIRISPRFCPHTSCDLGARSATGVIRLGATLCCISRGIGETVVPVRFRCKPQVGLYTLRHGVMDGHAREGVVQTLAW